ncbi:MAG TPA: FAD-dependent oxidoreductase [Bacteroidales bacterium]|nr:FAD-dependent oxidoreductase [Bacteroidales bacterium]
MGFKQIDLILPPDFSDAMMRSEVAKVLGISEFTCQIVSQSLDARKKSFVHWLVRVGVCSEHLSGDAEIPKPSLKIPYKKRKQKVLVLGSGPAGFFSAYVLQLAGFNTVLVERGSMVDLRARQIAQFEDKGVFHPQGNYAFGEGGAGTFSDGKLTSRSKHISAERRFIAETYIAAGAPKEIAWLAHPHIGSDNLQKVVAALRLEYQNLGGTILFETRIEDIQAEGRNIVEAYTASGAIKSNIFVLAPGHSAYETYRMLMKRGVAFRLKNFAIGSRAEHRQELINKAQWGVERLPGVKAAEYRLASSGKTNQPVYTFCMCPGGVVVPSTAYALSNTVNGMSFYPRDGRFANAACVAGVHPTQLAPWIKTPYDALLWLEQLEQSYFAFSGKYAAPSCTIADFLKGKSRGRLPESSFPLGLVDAPLWSMMPKAVVDALRFGLTEFNLKVKGYSEGVLIGLESKTSSPVQVIRDSSGLCEGFDNLYLVGEGSGYAGGIMSSAADGIKAAIAIIAAY